MQKIYLDRWGKQHIKTPEIPTHHRKGAWFILYHNNAILFTHPNYAPLVPEFPGGGVDENETLLEAAYRELYEETELTASSLKINKEYKQNVRFFADDLSEFWNYDQTYFFVLEKLENLYFKNKRAVSEGHCEWIKIEELNRYQINYMHKKALHKFM